MILDTVSLSSKYPDATLKPYVHEEASSPRPAVVVCPGGGYHFVSPREAEPIAEFYYNAGMNAYILTYSVAETSSAANYAPLIEVGMAIKYVRENAKAHNTHPEKVVTCGFSAGGHLAASAGILYNVPEVRDALGITDGTAPEGINKPNGMILSYAVITAGKHAHRGSICKLYGREEFGTYTEEEGNRFSLELHITPETPPMFIWHTATDTLVPVQNSTLLVEKCIENGITFEAHIYPYGPHGMALGNDAAGEGIAEIVDPHVATWAPMSVMWINDLFNK